MQTKIGTAPVTWGVWFPDDVKQMPWDRCMDEMAEAGYTGVELGPWGYLPNNFKTLNAELSKRNLNLVSTTLMGDLTSNENVDYMISILDNIAKLQRRFETAQYIILIDDCYTDLITGEIIRPKNLSKDEMSTLINNIIRIRDYARKEYHLKVLFHPHAETHIETEEQIEILLSLTDIELCFDTGHHAYVGSDPITFFKKHYHRIPYIHLKNINADIRDKKDKENWSLGKAVQEGIMVELDAGIMDMMQFAKVLKEVDYSGWIIFEQDMYPAPFDKPLPIAKGAREYLRKLEVG